MSISFACACGRSFKVADSAAGRKARCPDCGAVLTVPAAPAAEPEMFELAPDPVSTPSAEPRSTGATAVAARPAAVVPVHPALARPARSLRDYVYLLLILAFVPLAVSLALPQRDVTERLAETIAAHPELEAPGGALSRLDEREDVTLTDVLMALPNHRIQDALLPRDTYMHWVFALVSAAAFLGAAAVLFGRMDTKLQSLVFAALFTATIGILFLFAVQWAATVHLGGIRIPGKLAIFYLIIRLIGLSYACAEDPSIGIVASFFGFTLGVGLCEEFTKVIPTLFRLRAMPGQDDLSWRGACLWGLASGVGFGVAEGILYSSRHYNGVDTGSLYLIRFVSCVGLHAVWAASASITLRNHSGTLEGTESIWSYLGHVALYISGPMALHGLYDTLLKKDHEAMALLTALVSFGYLAYQIEAMKRKEGEGVLAAVQG